MQVFLVSLIIAAAVWIVWKHMAPRTLRLSLNRIFIQIARQMGWIDTAEKLVEKGKMVTNESTCGTCNGCHSKRQSGCETAIRPEDLRKRP